MVGLRQEAGINGASAIAGVSGIGGVGPKRLCSGRQHRRRSPERLCSGSDSVVAVVGSIGDGDKRVKNDMDGGVRVTSVGDGWWMCFVWCLVLRKKI